MLQTEGLQQAVVDGLHDLARCCLPPKPQETTSPRRSYGASKPTSTSFACSRTNVRAITFGYLSGSKSRGARAARRALEGHIRQAGQRIVRLIDFDVPHALDDGLAAGTVDSQKRTAWTAHGMTEEDE